MIHITRTTHIVSTYQETIFKSGCSLSIVDIKLLREESSTENTFRSKSVVGKSIPLSVLMRFLS